MAITLKKFERIVKTTSELMEYNSLLRSMLYNSDVLREKYIKQYKIYQHGVELGYTHNEVYDMIRAEIRKRSAGYEFNKRPVKEGRDNKDVYVGSGGSNQNRVRYPSKKRSLRTWKKFYDLFPYYAEKDNFDGKTSDKMK
jgi:hypothetical protein